MSRLCREVTLIHRRDVLTASGVYVRALEASPVRLLWRSRVVGLESEGGVLSGLRVEDAATGATRTLACQGLFIAIGRVPDTALLQGQLTLDPAGYVPAGEDTRTELPGVFAVGDMRQKPLRQIVTAAADGAVAAAMAEEYLTKLAR